jgi:hypothetical protein
MKIRVPPASLDAPEPIAPPDEPGFTVRNTPATLRLKVRRGVRLCVSRLGKRAKSQSSHRTRSITRRLGLRRGLVATAAT